MIDRVLLTDVGEVSVVQEPHTMLDEGEVRVAIKAAGICGSEDIESNESEDTISILNRYIDEAEVDLDKSLIKELLKNVYIEACEVD